VHTGWGLVAVRGSRGELVESGVLRAGSASVPFAKRLHRLQVEFERLVRRLAPDAAAVESPYHGANSRSALQLAHARGVLLAVLAGAGVEIHEYAPATVKKAVTGSGRADKEQVRAMVVRLLGNDAAVGRLDLSDALAVALCHASSLGLRRALDGVGERLARAAARRGPRGRMTPP
jgi:crossover junction endodeoxyribonuclease RuvC